MYVLETVIFFIIKALKRMCMKLIKLDGDYIRKIKKMMVAISPQLAALSVGGSMVYPTLLLQQLKNETFVNMDIGISSWIGSIYGLSGIPVIFMPMLMQWKGRKISYIITCLFTIIGWSQSLTANSVAMILLSESFHGFGTNSLLPVSFLGMTEMLAPEYRFISMQIFGINLTLGVSVAGILGKYLHYKTVSAIMLVPVLLAVAVAFFWTESPAWLAHKGKLDQCEKMFKWLRGTDERSMRELTELIRSQKEGLKQTKTRFSCQQLWDKVTQRDFYIPALHIYILLNCLYWSGGDVIVIYFIEMVQKSTNNNDAAFYASIAMYVILFIGAVVTNITIRHFKNKNILIFSTLGCSINLFCICIVTFLQSLDILAPDSLLCMYFLVGYMLFFSLGLNSVVFYISAELMPVKHRSIGGALLIIFNCSLYASTLKISPYLLQSIKMSGTFLIYTLNSLVCATIVWIYVPETKGRTLQEIEQFYAYGKFEYKHGKDNCVTPLTSAKKKVRNPKRVGYPGSSRIWSR